MGWNCPKCKEKVEISPANAFTDTIYTCNCCRSELQIHISLELIREALSNEITPTTLSSASSHETEFNSVLIAVDGEITRELIRDLLTEGNYKVYESSDGKDVMEILRENRPGTALIDVGLSEVLGFQLCEQIKSDSELKATNVILVASIYDISKYKRKPDSLYGAEDYIERHQLQEDLILKVKKHIGDNVRKSPEDSGLTDEPLSVTGNCQSTINTPTETYAVNGPTNTQTDDATSLTQEQIAAKRLARIIIADVVLYNKKEVEEGVHSESFRELLKDQLDEGRRHYDTRVSEQVRADQDYFEEAIEDFIRKKKLEICNRGDNG